MSTVRRLLFFVLALLLGIVLFQNQHSLGHPLEFLFFRWSFSLVLGFWLLLSFLLGAALIAALDFWKGVLSNAEIRRRGREIARLEKELEEARKPGAEDA